MLKKINFTMLLATVACLMISVGIVTGTIQNYIHFANVENEIGACAMSMFGTIMFTLGIKK